jgi:hypothetical protein
MNNKQLGCFDISFGNCDYENSSECNASGKCVWDNNNDVCKVSTNSPTEIQSKICTRYNGKGGRDCPKTKCKLVNNKCLVI